MRTWRTRDDGRREREPGLTSAAARRLLEEERVAVAPGETFGPAGAGTVRLSLASPLQDVAEAIGRIARAVRGVTVPHP